MSIVNATILTEMDGTTSKTKLTLKSGENTLVIDYDAKYPDNDKIASALMRAFGRMEDGEKKQETKPLRIGSTVCVRDVGKQYRHYSQWAINHLSQQQLISFGIGSGRDFKDKCGEVVAIAPHSASDKRLLVAVEVHEAGCHDAVIGIFAADGVEVMK